MSYKPGDFFIGVHDFFGIVVPGAVLLFLQRQLFAGLLGGQIGDNKIAVWIVFFLGSYVLGHFVLALGVPMNRVLPRLFPQRTDVFYQEAQSRMCFQKKSRRADAFHRAYSFVRLESPSASADIDRQVGDYELFRSLTLVFALDLLFAGIHWIFWGPLPLPRVLFSITMLCLAAGRFPFLQKWAYRSTFEYYTLLTNVGGREKAPNPVGEADG